MKRTSYPRTVPRSLKVTSLVCAAMAALLFATFQEGRSRRAERALGELPSTARAVLKVDTRALQRSGAARTVFRALVAEDQLSEIETICGLNPLKALSEATLWVRGPDEQPFQSIGLMLRGQTVDAETLAQCHRLLVETRGGSIVRLDGAAGPVMASRDRRSAIAVLDGRSIVTGSVQTVAEAIAVRRGALPSLQERSPLAELWRQMGVGTAMSALLDPPQNWKSALERIAMLGNEASAMEGVQAIALSVRPNGNQNVDVYIEVADEALAERNAALISAWSAHPPNSVKPPWTEVLQSAVVELRERQIHVSVDVTSLARIR